jgi:acyl-[acyl carrier protein]--UDP-N-acetylglucosamine O-acyltransferase
MKTVIGDNCLIMAYCHIAHDCTVGKNCIFSNNSTLAGCDHMEVKEQLWSGRPVCCDHMEVKEQLCSGRPVCCEHMEVKEQK